MRTYKDYITFIQNNGLSLENVKYLYYVLHIEEIIGTRFELDLQQKQFIFDFVKYFMVVYTYSLIDVINALIYLISNGKIDRDKLADISLLSVRVNKYLSSLEEENQ